MSRRTLRLSKRDSETPLAERQDRMAALIFTVTLHLIALTLALNAAQVYPLLPEVLERGPISMSLSASDDPQPDQQPGRPQQPTKDPQPEEPTPTTSASEQTALPELAGPPSTVTPASSTSTSDTPDPSAFLSGIGGGTAGRASAPAASRSGSTKATNLTRNGGGAQTEAAVASGLRWLASVHSKQTIGGVEMGWWEAATFMRAYLPQGAKETATEYWRRTQAEGPGAARHSLGLTALCLLAFTGAGHGPSSAEYGDLVRATLAYIESRQDARGCFLSAYRDSSGDMYDHALCLLALADASVLTGSEAWRASAKLGLEFMLGVQKAGGGWDYHCYLSALVRDRNDQSITGYCVMALMSCRAMGLKVPEENLRRAISFVSRAVTAEGAGIYADAGTGIRSGRGMTAVNLFLRRLLGEPTSTPIQLKQRQMLTSRLPRWGSDGTGRDQDDDPYMWYYASLSLMPDGGPDWDRYNIALKDALIGAQIGGGGPQSGSWPANTLYASQEAGRVYATAIACLCLEVYYRYAPEYLTKQATQLSALWPAK